MKLYVWEEVLVDYTGGVMFALANSADEARELILDKMGYFNSVKRDLKREPKVVTTPEGFGIWGGG